MLNCFVDPTGNTAVVFITASFAHAQPDNYRPDARTVLRLIRNDKLDLVLPGAMRDNSVEKVVEKARGILRGWNDAMELAAWLSDRTGLPFTLPTEAQWEKAARGTPTSRLT